MNDAKTLGRVPTHTKIDDASPSACAVSSLGVRMGSRVSVSGAVVGGEITAPGERTPGEPGSTLGAGAHVLPIVNNDKGNPSKTGGGQASSSRGHLSLRVMTLPNRQ